MTHAPRLTMPSLGGLKSNKFKYQPGGTSMDLHKRMARYRAAVVATPPLVFAEVKA